MLALGLAAGLTPAIAAANPITARGVVAAAECERPGLDDRCEQWTVDGVAGSRMVVSPASDRLFTWRAGTSEVMARDAATGQQLWKASVAGISSSDVPVRGLAVNPDGTEVYAVGDDLGADALSSQDRDLVVAAHDAGTGAVVWTRILALPAIDENDRYVSREQGAAIAASPDGRRVYVTGDTRLYDRILSDWVTNDDVFVAGYDAASGDQRWVAIWDQRYSEVHGRFLAVSPDSRKVYLGGTHATCGLGPAVCPPDFLALAFRAHHPPAPGQEGELLWDALYDGFGGPDEPAAMDLAPDGSTLYLTGSSGGVAWGPDYPDYDWATVAYHTGTGAEAWVSRYQGLDDDRPDPVNRHYPDGDHRPARLVASPTGDMVFVTGTFSAFAVGDTRDVDDSAPPATVHEATLAYDAATGEQMWVAHFSTLTSTSAAAPALGPHHASPGTSAASLAVSPDGGRVYVAGADSGPGSAPTGNAGQVTAAYDAGTGGQIWIARLPGNGGAQVEATPDGTSVFTRSTNGSIHAYHLP